MRARGSRTIRGRLVAHIGQQRHLLELDHLGQPLDQLGLGHLIGDLGDHHLPEAAGQLLDLPGRAQADRAAARAVGLGQALGGFHHHPAGGKIGAGQQRHQPLVRQVGVGDQGAGGGAELVQVVRRDVGGHPHRDPCRAIGQKVREGARQDHRFGQRAVVVGAEIDRVLVQPFEQGLGGLGQAGLGIAAGGGVVAVDVAEVALPVHQRVADGEVLRQPRHRIVDRGIAVRMVVAHHVARDLGRLAETAARRQPQLAHRIEDAAVHGLEPVARIGQRPVHDRAEGILQIAAAQRPAQGFGVVGLGDWLRGAVVGHGAF